MSNRLLRESDVKQALAEAYMKKQAPLGISEIYKAVENVKTAYDVEKVIDNLESNKFEEHDEPWKDRWDEAMNEAIKIVKEGGRNDV